MADKKTEKKKGKKGKTKTMHIRKADSGGFVANHDMLPEEMEGKMQQPPPQEHVLPDLENLKAHVQDHFGDEEEQEPSK
jgi:hypothetical protein